MLSREVRQETKREEVRQEIARRTVPGALLKVEKEVLKGPGGLTQIRMRAILEKADRREQGGPVSPS